MSMTDSDEFLAHVGVKGMKWGVRKAKQGRASYKQYKSRSLEDQQKIRRKHAKRAAITGVAVVGTALVARNIYNKNKKVTVGVAKYGFQTKNGRNFAAGYNQKKVRVKDIPKLQNDPWARSVKTWVAK